MLNKLPGKQVAAPVQGIDDIELGDTATAAGTCPAAYANDNGWPVELVREPTGHQSSNTGGIALITDHQQG